MDISRNGKTVTSHDKSIFDEFSIICGCKTIPTLQDRRSNTTRSFSDESLLRCSRNRYAIITFKNCQYVLPVNYFILFLPICINQASYLFRVGGLEAIMSCFDYESLPLTIANPIVILACNVKLWLNYHTNVHVFVPLRSKVLRFMCNLSDKELRTPAAKTMAGKYIIFK